MKFTKIISLVLCFMLLASPALAQTESEKMQDALTKTKTILTIPEEYTEFSYQSETDTDGTAYWYFSWSGEKKGNIDATLSEDGFLATYYAWIYTDSYDDSLAKYTHEEAKTIAREFIQRVNPEIYPSLREVTLNNENRDSRTARFVFQEYIGEIPVYANTISVTVDKYHGIVRNYQGAKKTEGVSPEAVTVSEAEAKAIYIKEIGIEMEYQLYYNYREKSHTVFPVYFLKDASGKAIDARNTEVLSPYFPESYLFGVHRGIGSMDSMAAMTAKEESAGVQFTPEELAAITNLEDVYSQEEAYQIAVEKIPALKDFSINTASLQRDFQDESKLFWYLHLKDEDSLYAGVQLNAKTAQLMSFSLPSKTYENKSFSREEAKKIAEAFLQKEASDVFEKTQYTEENSRVIPLSEDKLPNSYWFTYERVENGIPVGGNQLSVRVDASTKKVGAYERSWTENIEFPDISTCISKEEILEIMDEQMDFSITYLPTEEEYRPAYTFLQASTQIYDPFSGKMLSYDGTPISENVIPVYTDIQNHWAEAMILTLLDNGYYLCEEEFRPNAAITKKEFLKLFRMIGNDTDEQINELIARIEEIPVEQADANAALTKETVSRYFIYRMGYQKIAKLDHIFVYPFLDAHDADQTLKGDIALTAGLGIFLGSSDGNFYPQKQLTRAEAVSTIYHYLKNSN